MANEKKGAAFIDAAVLGSKRCFKLGNVTEATELARRLLECKMEGDVSREQWMWELFLNHVDPRIAFESFRLLTAYKYGRPTEKQQIQVTDNNVAEVPAKMSNDEWAKRFAPPPARDKKADA